MDESRDQIRKRVLGNIERCNRLREHAYKNFQDVLDAKKHNLVFISMEQLRTLNIGERIKFANDVEFEKISETQNEMLFHTIMVEGGRFSLHFHDCIEITKVLEGTMIETQKGDRLSTKIYKVGDRAIYDKGEQHSMTVDEYTLLEVRFLTEI